MRYGTVKDITVCMQAKWTEFIQEGFEMLGMKLMLLIRMLFLSIFLEMYQTLKSGVFHISSFFF